MKIVDVKSVFGILKFDRKKHVTDNIQDHSIMVLLWFYLLHNGYLLKLCLQY